MFTGIIEEKGTLLAMQRQGEAYRLTIGASKVLTDVNLGDSIAVNGICLTVTSYRSNQFTVDAVPETVRRTTLSGLKPGALLNLERAMAAGGRFGGHFVAGHVDAVGHIRGSEREGNAVVYTIQPTDPSVMKYMLPKGSVAIDGISLTIMDVDQDGFRVSVIPHTMVETTLPAKAAGDLVNLECDMLGKYIERFLMHRFGDGSPGHGGTAAGSSSSSAKKGITEQFLIDNGYV
jgi:riboflavin synthase